MLAAAVLLFTAVGSGSAPQQAAGAALACGLAIIPYVFSRCIQLVQDRWDLRERDKLTQAAQQETNRLLDLLVRSQGGGAPSSDAAQSTSGPVPITEPERRW